MSRSSQARVVDTNVLLVADRLQTADTSEAEIECIYQCVQALRHIMRSGQIVLDEGRLILSEYNRKLPRKKQPSVGSEFWRWVHRHQAMATHCSLIRISATDAASSKFAEFPDHPALANFDADDRKFVAVAAAHPKKPPILQAVDAKWWQLWREALNDCGISVVYLCELIVADTARKPKSNAIDRKRRR